jgi:hypothetical protein
MRSTLKNDQESKYMTSYANKLAVTAILVVVVSASRSLAQAPTASPYYSDWALLQSQRGEPVGGMPMAPPTNPGLTSSAPTPDFGAGWPRPPEVPPSLFRQAPDPMPYACAPIPGRYFELDPLVDPPSFPQTGFVADVEIQAVGAHVFQSLSNGVPVGGNPPGSLRVPITPLDWTVSPRVEFGWRLPEGFGAFMLNYQYIGTMGTGSTPYGPNGPASQSGRLNFNLSDFDYVSREFTPWEHWGMQWRVGFRQVYIFYDTDLNTPLAAAAASNGIAQLSGANGYDGWGGHIGVQMDRDLYQILPGLSFVANLDFGDTTGFVHQRVSQTTVAGAYSFGTVSNGQESPSLSGEMGFSYRHPGGRFEAFLGGFYQYWWNIGTLPNYATNGSGTPLSGGELSLTGVTFRLSFNY